MSEPVSNRGGVHLKRALIIVAVAVPVILVGAFFLLRGEEFVIRISEEDIRSGLVEHLPLSKRYFRVFDVTLDHPRVTVAMGDERIRAGLDVTVSIAIGDPPLSLSGTIDASAGIDYRAGSFFLDDPVVDGLEIDRLPALHQARIRQAITLALDEYTARFPVYTLDSTDFNQSVARMILRDVSAEDGHLLITLGL